MFQQRPIVLVLDRIPWHEPFFVGRQPTDSRRNPIADDQSHVVGQQVELLTRNEALSVKVGSSESDRIHIVIGDKFLWKLFLVKDVDLRICKV